MKAFIQIILLSIGWANQVDVTLPNSFKNFGNQPLFKSNSIKWVKAFAKTSEENSQYLKALHAWFYLYKNKDQEAKSRIENILKATNQRIARLLFLKHSKQLYKLSLNAREQQHLREFFDYFTFRHGIHTNSSVTKQDFAYNKYILSESYFHHQNYEDQLLFLKMNHSDPYGILAYHKLRTKAVLNEHKLKQYIPDTIDIFFKSNLEIFHHNSFLNVKKNIVVDPEQMDFLVKTSKYTPDEMTLNLYPYLVLSMMTKQTFQWNKSTWNAFLKLLNNPFWQPKIKSHFEKYYHLKDTLRQVSYLLNPYHTKSNIKKHSQATTSIVNNIKLIHDPYWPSPLLKTIFDSVKALNTSKAVALTVSWENLKTPFIFDILTNELVLSYRSITWSKEKWISVLKRNYFHFQLIQHALTLSAESGQLIPLWILDSISNVKTAWTPEQHGLNLNQTKNLSIYPLSYSSLNNSIRNIKRPSLFFAYHWQCIQIGKILFTRKKTKNILDILSTNNTFTTDSEFIKTMSKLFNSTPENLRAVLTE